MAQAIEQAWQKLEELAGELSPENLYCDGEISHAAAMRKRARLLREWKEQERVIGHEVSEGDVWDRVMARDCRRW